MRKRVWDAAAAVSVLLFAAAAVLWVRSYWIYDEAGLRLGRHLFACGSAAGDTSWVWDTDFPGDPHSYVRRSPLKDSVYADGMGRYFEQRFAGFAVRYRDEAAGPTGMVFRVLVVPHWFLLVVTAVAPAYWLAVTRRHRRRAVRGQCAGCGYDLRASSERCPECGRSI